MASQYEKKRVWQPPTAALIPHATLYIENIQIWSKLQRLAGGSWLSKLMHPEWEAIYMFFPHTSAHKLHRSINFSLKKMCYTALFCTNATHLKTQLHFLFYNISVSLWQMCFEWAVVTVPTRCDFPFISHVRNSQWWEDKLNSILLYHLTFMKPNFPRGFNFRWTQLLF